MAEGLRERNKREKLERAKKAARELFARQGFEATTIRQIAEHAGIGLGTLYSYVQTKHELLDLVFLDDWGRVEDESYASLPEDAGLVDALLHVFGRMMDHYARDPEMSRLYVRETLFPGAGDMGPRLERGLRVIQRVGGLVGRAQQRGEVDSRIEPLSAATNLFGLYLFHLSAWLSGIRGQEDTRAALRTSLELQLRGLRPDTSPGRKSRT
ncbi:TetR/AcrR family transcriptional regulator [Archangium lipolyticum]|uniref:TetR/AcrR family transcriptional regulator n=1 Tax=Archangium lipolyticum TaxID=2970465 RepID=UPI002149ADE1|nr:TetR/AcrR family transcriptional regulator [Archangium lipolyticum]